MVHRPEASSTLDIFETGFTPRVESTRRLFVIAKPITGTIVETYFRNRGNIAAQIDSSRWIVPLSHRNVDL
jgi:hypothetical protein